MAVALEQFVKQIEDSGVIAPGKLENFVPPKAHPKDSQELAQLLVRSKYLTKFQAQEIYQGRAKSLILGNYTILDKIGAGGMGQVFKAQHRRMERTVAVKMLPKAVTKDANAIARFQREVVAAAKLRHPNIVAADDADEAGGVHFLVMEYIEGSDLSALVKKHGPLSVPKALNYVLQAAHGFEFAHKKGVIHRDVKPGNLLLDSEGTVKILDMGLARLSSDGDGPTQNELTSTGAIMGTVDYMAPEQALSTKSADARADIYSLGCTLYYLITGKDTYDGDTMMAKLLAHREMPIPAMGGEVPEQVQAVFEKMVAKDVGDRYQTMSEVVAALRECVSGQNTSRSIQQTVGTNSDLGALTFLKDIPVRAAKPSKVVKPPPLQNETGKRPRKRIVIAGGAALLGFAILAGMIFKMMPQKGRLTIDIDEDLGKDVQVVVNQGGAYVKVANAKSGWTLSLGAGDYDLAVQGGDERYQLEPQKITVAPGGEVTVRVALAPPMPAVAPFDAQQAKKYQDRWARQLGLPVEITNSIGMKLVYCPPGSFIMGSPAGERGRLADREAQVAVTISKGFYLGKYSVTQAEFKSVVGASPWAGRPNVNAGDDYPAGYIDWNDAAEFCRKLTARESQAGRLLQGYAYALPTEAQREYACRAGTASAYFFGGNAKDLGEYAWYEKNMGGPVPHPVGQKKPNAWGLYDMYGNVYEWCRDGYAAKLPGGTDPFEATGSQRVYRGGCLAQGVGGCRSAVRCNGQPAIGGYNMCFRVALVPADKPNP